MRVRGLLVCLVLCACGHTEALHDGMLEKGDTRIHLGPVPPEWRPIHVEGADVAYRDEARQGSTLFDVRCGARDDDAPLSVLTEHLIMGTTQREYDSQETVPFDGREALHTLMRAKLDGVPMQYDIFVMKKNGCVYDLVYVAPPDRFSQGAPAFEAFARGLHAATPNEANERVGGRNAAPANDP
ncbi:MAG TPA: hypothetical protein VMI75_22625 [Polyangiaceae bacterium]|nr:hypothetical protein [Polyangiaceae bacterium]